MLTCDHLARHPRAFRRLTGFDRAWFDALFDDDQGCRDRSGTSHSSSAASWPTGGRRCSAGRTSRTPRGSRWRS